MQALVNTSYLSPWTPSIFSLIVYFLLVLAIIAALLFLSAWLGAKKTTEEKQRPYESGIIPTGSARIHFPVPFYLVAIFFLIFDVEGAYIFAWAIACKQLGWAGWLQISFFIVVLLVGLVYIWRKGGIEWGPSSMQR